MKILIVEDEQKTATYLRKGFSESGFAVDLADRGDDGFYLASQGHYDVIVLDIMLPQRDGWSILSDLRQSGNQTPILMLTARDAVQDRVKGLEAGADDYLVKPFAFSELLARIRTILRRGSKLQTSTLRIADLEIDFAQHWQRVPEKASI